MFYFREPEDLDELEDVVLAGYVEGLADAGWRGDERLVRLGYTAGIAMRWGCAPYWALIGDEPLVNRIEWM
jgi:hypothetical protein